MRSKTADLEQLLLGSAPQAPENAPLPVCAASAAADVVTAPFANGGESLPSRTLIVEACAGTTANAATMTLAMQ
jgi:hypothetical protein